MFTHMVMYKPDFECKILNKCVNAIFVHIGTTANIELALGCNVKRKLKCVVRLHRGMCRSETSEMDAILELDWLVKCSKG